MGNRRRRKEGAELVVTGRGRPSRGAAWPLLLLLLLLLAQVEFSQLTFRLANISVVITIEGSIVRPPPLALRPLSAGQMMIEDDDDEREIERIGGRSRFRFLLRRTDIYLGSKMINGTALQEKIWSLGLLATLSCSCNAKYQNRHGI